MWRGVAKLRRFQPTGKEIWRAAAVPPGIWISSGVRGVASRLRKFSGFGCLDSLGFPWILSTEMSLFKGLRASLREFFSRSDLSPRKEPLPDERPIEPLRFA